MPSLSNFQVGDRFVEWWCQGCRIDRIICINTLFRCSDARSCTCALSDSPMQITITGMDDSHSHMSCEGVDAAQLFVFLVAQILPNCNSGTEEDSGCMIDQSLKRI